MNQQPSSSLSAAATAESAAAAKLEAKRLKAEKAALRRIKKCMQPKECMKHVTVLLDDRLANHEQLGPALIGCLNGQQVDTLSSSPTPTSLPAIRWRRNVQVLDPAAFADLAHDAVLTGGGGFQELEDDALLVIEGRQLASLLSEGQQLESLVFCADPPPPPTTRWAPTLVVFDLDRHLTQTSRAAEGNALRAKVQLQNSQGIAATQKPPPQKRQKVDQPPALTRLQCEEAFLDLQLARGVTVRLVEDPVQLGKLTYCLTKAVAERPFKAARLDSAFSFHVDSVGAGCRLQDDGVGGMDDLWRCQLQCFPLVTGEVSRAILRAYPSPGHLIRAYSACANGEEAVRLIADLQVCKGTGPLSSARRLGPELGKRLYAFYSTRDANLVL